MGQQESETTPNAPEQEPAATPTPTAPERPTEPENRTVANVFVPGPVRDEESPSILV